MFSDVTDYFYYVGHGYIMLVTKVMEAPIHTRL